jgi:20S proteasome alpha/beta subunit
MTVCVAALTDDRKTVVLVADKAITYGGYFRPAVQAESGGIQKMLSIGDSTWKALMSGNATATELIIRRAGLRLAAQPDLAGSLDSMMETVKTAYQEARDQGVDDEVLRPRLLTKELLIARPSTLVPLDSQHFGDVAKRVADFRMGCDLLVCGFDAQGTGHIFSVHDPGVVNSHELEGYYAIGIGAESAISRLAWHYAEPSDSLDFGLYQTLAAKLCAQSIQGVGWGSDMWVMLPDRTEKVPAHIVDLVRDVFYRANRLPFRRRRNWNVKDAWPRNWETILKSYADGLLGGHSS